MIHSIVDQIGGKIGQVEQMNERSNYELLIYKLDQFIRKYYINGLIRGALYTVAAVLAMFLIFSILEHYFYFSQNVRKIFFFGFIATAMTVLSVWVIDPLIRYFRLGKTISHEQAAVIIGQHFHDVKDKLLNVLQLKKQAGSLDDRSLIEASIQQKSSEIKLVPFSNAIDLRKNKRYLRYALPPAMVLIVIIFAAPSIITDSTYRIVNNNKDFEKEAPFSFHIENPNLKAVQFSDFTLQVSADGNVVPENVYIDVNNFQYRLQKTAQGQFSYTFKNVQKETPFRLLSGKVTSKPYTLSILPKPSLSSLAIDLKYPSYTGRKNESLASTGDLVIPEGTRITWHLDAVHTDDIQFLFYGEDKLPAKRQGTGNFHFERIMRQNASYKIYYGNSQLESPDSVGYSISVIKDQYPTISVDAIADSLESSLVYFVGMASDDYGLKEVLFHINLIGADGKEKMKDKQVIRKVSDRSTQFNHILDIDELGLNAGDKLSYYFEVWDNDAVNGSKSARSSVMTFAKPTFEEFRDLEQMNEEQIKEELNKSMEETRKLREELQKLRDKLLQQQDVNWQDKKELEKLLERQKEIQDKLKSAKEKFDENQKNQQEFNPQNEDLLQKQEKINELFDKVMDNEMKDLMDKIQQLMQELKKDDLLKSIEDMQRSEQLQQMDMDRLLNLYKQLEMEKEITEQAKALEKLADKQDDLSEKTQDAEGKNDELIEEQEKLNKEFEKLSQKMEELMEKNQELSPPKGMDPEMNDQMNDIGSEMEKSKEQMDKQNNKDASKSQQKAAQKMRNAASNMMEQMESGEMEQIAEDIKALRQLLENLVNLSFDQEDLHLQLRNMVVNTPQYVRLIQDQFKLKGDFKLIEDSLYALSLRRPEIETFVTDKTLEIKRFVDKSIGELEERYIPEAMESQRNSMTNVNDLALMLSESLQNMQSQMAGMMAGNQMCTNPNGSGESGSVPIDKITEGQQGMEGELQKMGEKMQNGEGNSAEDFARAAARQAALRKALEEIQRQSQEEGKGAQGLQDIIDQMDKMEIDLVNKRLDNETLLRQQDIITRLLEAEKADRTRELDDKRKAEQAKEKRREFPPSLQEYLKQREAEIEMYKTISPDLKPYYKILVNEYYKALKGEK